MLELGFNIIGEIPDAFNHKENEFEKNECFVTVRIFECLTNMFNTKKKHDDTNYRSGSLPNRSRQSG